ncbi:hypothetical protein ABZ249_18040 [Nocardiopsis sp. NPDC006139]|uniref:hypothetical protein n=1 Tax=Nocardiopsis TaxID=2013 RepID=UPI001597464A|nr:hypothetical protein HUT17_03635 [Nocardiopsis flavescens]
MDIRTPHPSTARPPHHTARWAVAAALWSLLYVASKVQYALAGRLGVTGGPAVPADSYAGFGPGGVAAAQWANAGVGLAVALLFLLAALPVARRVPRWLSLPPLGAVALMALAGAVGMVYRDLAEGSGGTVFGLYCLVWAALSAKVLVGLARARG